MSGGPPRVAFAASPEALDLDDGWPLLRDAARAARPRAGRRRGAGDAARQRGAGAALEQRQGVPRRSRGRRRLDGADDPRAAGGEWEPPAADDVVNPAVASGGIGGARYVRRGVEAARQHVAALHAAGQTALVQPYLPAVEAALVFFGERFSHAVAKRGVLEPAAAGRFADELRRAATAAARAPARAARRGTG